MNFILILVLYIISTILLVVEYDLERFNPNYSKKFFVLIHLANLFCLLRNEPIIMLFGIFATMYCIIKELKFD